MIAAMVLCSSYPKNNPDNNALPENALIVSKITCPTVRFSFVESFRLPGDPAKVVGNNQCHHTASHVSKVLLRLRNTRKTYAWGAMRM